MTRMNANVFQPRKPSQTRRHARSAGQETVASQEIATLASNQSTTDRIFAIAQSEIDKVSAARLSRRSFARLGVAVGSGCGFLPKSMAVGGSTRIELVCNQPSPMSQRC